MGWSLLEHRKTFAWLMVLSKSPLNEADDLRFEPRCESKHSNGHLKGPFNMQVLMEHNFIRVLSLSLKWIHRRNSDELRYPSRHELALVINTNGDPGRYLIKGIFGIIYFLLEFGLYDRLKSVTFRHGRYCPMVYLLDKSRVKSSRVSGRESI